MNEEKKYGVVGTVTIGSDEYRDLIEDVQKAISDRDRYMREGWNKDSKIKELTEQIETLKRKNKELLSILKNRDTKDESGDAFCFYGFYEE